MPRYDFHCPKCGLDFEVSRSFSRADEPANCPVDGTEGVRAFSMNTNFLMKGGSESATPPPMPPPSGGHGHSHGPGGHTH
ncbi:MAG TPA: zinc ribbon domain-containing protein [Dehalococcoidia bacterium]|nr:zinc ribbon domain-containing protein [Dehalococcoidia bacterium]